MKDLISTSIDCYGGQGVVPKNISVRFRQKMIKTSTGKLRERKLLKVEFPSLVGEKPGAKHLKYKQTRTTFDQIWFSI